MINKTKTRDKILEYYEQVLKLSNIQNIPKN